MAPPEPVTEVLAELSDGDDEALRRLLPVVYQELQRLARRELRGQAAGHTLNTTALVHEAYLKLADRPGAGWRDRGHFLGVAARAMRQVLIDHARRYRTVKRGGAWRRVPLDEARIPVEEQAELLLEVDEALTRLAARHARWARVVECRFFGGLSEEETALALEVTTRTVRRDWANAKAWLYGELREVEV